MRNHSCYKAEYLVSYEGLKPDLTISFNKLMSFLQETSISHTDSTTYPMSWFSENNFGFLLTNWDVKVYNYPRLNEKLIVQTWPVSFNGILAFRSFEAYNASGQPVACANTKWVFTDLSKRRPVKMPLEIGESYGHTNPFSYEPDFNLPSAEANYTKVDSSVYTITRRDIDSNHHVNNVKYIEWAMDYIPEKLFDKMNVSEMKAVYKKECVLNHRVLIETWQDKGSSEIITLIKDNDSGITHAGLYTKWSKTWPT